MAEENTTPEGQDSGSETASQRPLIVRCDKCAAVLRTRAWREGLVCPKCKAGVVSPVSAPGGAVDYLMANRKEGYAIEDIRVAQWARWSGLITPHQYDVAFVRQRKQVSAGEKVQPIHEILIAEEAVSPGDATAVLEFMARERPDEDDDDFAQRAVEAGIADKQKVETIRRTQAEMAAKQHEVPPLAQLLFEKRVLDEGRMLAILNMQKAAGLGSLARIEAMRQANRKQSLYERVAKGVKPPKQQLKNIALVVLVFLTAGALWYYNEFGHRVKVAVICAKCRAESVIAWPHRWPAKCPKCGAMEAYFAVKCIRCGRVYSRASPWSREKCPRCGATTAVPLLEVPAWEKQHRKIGTGQPEGAKAAPKEEPAPPAPAAK